MYVNHPSSQAQLPQVIASHEFEFLTGTLSTQAYDVKITNKRRRLRDKTVKFATISHFEKSLT